MFNLMFGQVSIEQQELVSGGKYELLINKIKGQIYASGKNIELSLYNKTNKSFSLPSLPSFPTIPSI